MIEIGEDAVVPLRQICAAYDGQHADRIEDFKAASSRLEFEVAMNTHSVDLSMDLSQLATLTTDTGVSVQANGWDAPGGGHHVSGKLSFPATKDGKAILEGATKITITIINVDAPSRTFEWQLQ